MEAQLKLGIPSIGGKDSMSGTFETIDVPPTLVSFAVAMTKASKTVSAEFKNVGSKVIYVPVPENKETLMPDWDKLIAMYKAVYKLFDEGKVLSASVVKEGELPQAYVRLVSVTAMDLNLQINSQMTSFSPLFQVHLFLSLQTVRNLTTV